jgi:tRNA-dihydrouridine synthase A
MAAMTTAPLDRRLCVAPMMDWTDRHCRYFHRLLAPRALLYTEMLTTGAILHGGPERFLAFDPAESPVALQLGGSEPLDLAACARLAERYGYAEVNLNCGCPSERVQKGAFGACLMREPELVAGCIRAMREATSLPVTVKCRIGVDDSDDTLLWRFVDTIAAAGCGTVIVHARKAWLRGLSPKENREVPPLCYGTVERLKQSRPELEVIVNGGIIEPAAALAHRRWADGVMVGREAYQNPWSLTAFAATLQGTQAAASRAAAVARMSDYASVQARRGVPMKAIARHMLGLFNGLPGARAWRRRLSEGMQRADAGPSLLGDALRCIRPEPALAA